VEEIVSSIGYPYQRYNKGTLVVTVDGADNSKTVALSSHVDTLGLMVRSISSSGELMITPHRRTAAALPVRRILPDLHPGRQAVHRHYSVPVSLRPCV
jgi:hypothetical protein